MSAAGAGASSKRGGFGAPARLQFAAHDPCRRGAAVDFSFTEEQLMIQDVARRIAQEKIAPTAEHFDRSGEFPSE
ncbi:acyl-CoA dehydrogenase family protein, partial [Salmonella sp. SAL04269]|uniref:acyl-CoA dehydrogenase family protein n=1 Tax=Salmonella sp. SAL04269 TaxID=3159847 RepID=UPI003979D727